MPFAEGFQQSCINSQTRLLVEHVDGALVNEGFSHQPWAKGIGMVYHYRAKPFFKRGGGFLSRKAGSPKSPDQKQASFYLVGSFVQPAFWKIQNDMHVALFVLFATTVPFCAKIDL